MKLTTPLFRKLVVCASFGFLLSSCEKAKELISINIPLETADIEFEIPATEAGTQTLAEFNVSLNVDSLITDYAAEYSIENVRSVKMKSCQLVLTNPTKEDQFGALSSCEAAMSSSGNSTWTTFAQVSNNPESYADTLNLTVSDTDLKSYFTSSTISYKVTGTLRHTTSETLQAKAHIKYTVEVGPK